MPQRPFPNASPVASFHLAQFRLSRSTSRLLTVPAERWELSATQGCVLGKVLGTSATGTTRFGANLRRWAIFAVWKSEADRTQFIERSSVIARWTRSTTSLEHFLLEPVSSRGTWSGVDPFADFSDRDGSFTGGGNSEPVAVVTRASVRWSKIVTFTRAIPKVDDALRAQPGCTLALGMGEWPIGQQATFSMWESEDAMTTFAQGGAAHSEVIRRTYSEGWYDEEMFSRFRVTGTQTVAT